MNCDYFYILSYRMRMMGRSRESPFHAMISSFLSRFFPPGLSGDSLYIIVHQVYDTRSECILGGIMCIVYSQFAEDVFLVRTYGKFAVESHGSYFLHTPLHSITGRTTPPTSHLPGSSFEIHHSSLPASPIQNSSFSIQN